MGCAKSTNNANADAALPPLDLTGLDGPSKFEAMLPFKRYKAETLETKFKTISGAEKKSFTLTQLREALGSDKVWADLSNDNSTLVKILTSEYFKSEDNEGEISRDAAIIYALLLSVGDAKTKARILYDVLQDNNQEFISANDKDFTGSFNLLIDLATKVLYAHLRLSVEEDPKIATSDFSKIDDLKETLSEAFLDDVYGAASKLNRKDWEAKVASS